MRGLRITEPASDASTSSVDTEVEAPWPGSGEVAIDVACAGVNFLDVMARRGDWPYLPGPEVAGTIRELGAGVNDRRVDERVAALTPAGGFAEIVVVPATPGGRGAGRRRVRGGGGRAACAVVSGCVAGRRGPASPWRERPHALGERRARRRGLDAGKGVRVVGSASKEAAAVEGVATRRARRGQRGCGDPRARAQRDRCRARLDRHAEARHGSPRRGARRADRAAVGQSSRRRPGSLPPLGRLIGGNLGLLGSASPPVTVLSRPVRDALQRSLHLLAQGRVHLDVTVVDRLATVPEIHERLAYRKGAARCFARLARQQ